MKNPKIAGALFDLMAYLTTRDETLTLGAKHETPPALDVLKEWAEKRGFDLDGADVTGWSTDYVPTALHHDGPQYVPGGGPLSVEAFQELVALYEKATQGPMVAGAVGDDDGPYVTLAQHAAHLDDMVSQTARAHGEGPLWEIVQAEGDEDERLTIAVAGNGPTSKANAHFIAAVMSAFPDLLSTINSLITLADGNVDAFQKGVEAALAELLEIDASYKTEAAIIANNLVGKRDKADGG